MDGLIMLVLGFLAVLIVLPCIALAKALSAEARIARLEREICELRRALNLPQPSPPEESKAWDLSGYAATPREEIRQLPEIEVPPEPEVPAPRLRAEVPRPQEERLFAPAEEAPAPAPAAEPRPSRTRADWEVLMGGNVFNRIGAIAVLIGVAYLLKYAFEHNWITPWMRVTMGFAAGGVLLFLGARFQRKDVPVFAQGLIGAGIAILYLSAYASFNLYHLVPQKMALLLMSAVTAIAILQSLKYDALSVSLLALIGGFLTPLLLSTGKSGGSGDALGLFTYVALLDIGLLAVALKKDDWAVLEVLTLAGTYITYAVWHEKYYAADMISLTIPFLTIFWAMFYSLDLYRIARPTGTYSDIRIAVPIMNSAAYYAFMYTDINGQYHHWTGFVTLMMGMAYFLTVLILIRRRAQSLVSIPRYATTALVLLVIATGIQYRGFTLVTLWSIEALFLAWCGIHWKARYVWIPALALFAIALSTLAATGDAFGYREIGKFRLMLNERFLAFMTLTVALAASAVLFRRLDDERVSRPICAVLHYSWCAVLFTALTVETTDYFRKLIVHKPYELVETYEFYRYIALALVWIAYSLALVWGGLRRQVPQLLASGLIVAALSITFAAIPAIASVKELVFPPLVNYRTMTLLLVIAALLVQRYWISRRREEIAWASGALEAFDLVVSLLGFLLLTVETVGYFHLFVARALRWEFGADMEFVRSMMLAMIWTVYGLGLVWVGLGKRSWSSLAVGAIASALGLGFTAVLAVTSFELAPLYAVANIRALTFILIIAGLFAQQWLLRGRREELPWSAGAAAVYDLPISLLGLELLTVEVVGYFARFTEGGQKWAAPVDVGLAQLLVLALVWAAYSIPLLWSGLRKDSKVFQCVALGSLALAVSWLAMGAYKYEPIGMFKPVWNPRSAAFAAVAIAMLIQHRILGRHSEQRWARTAMTVLKVTTSLFIFELLTVEIWDYLRGPIEATSNPDRIRHLHDLRQAALSVGWVVYSILLMGFGIWRRARYIRFVALALFDVTIVKVFLFDLASLETLYRIFSFIGLGVILLATSYLYQRFKTLIAET